MNVALPLSALQEMGTPPKKRGDHEFRLQCAIRDLLDRACPKHIPWTALENGERRPKASRQRCARKGVKNGWPDFQFILAGGLYVGLELKTAKDKLRGIQKGRMSPEQEETGEAIKAAGALYHVAYGWDEAVKFLTDWGIVKASSVVRPQPALLPEPA